jgi:hypothetical protein
LLSAKAAELSDYHEVKSGVAQSGYEKNKLEIQNPCGYWFL